MFSEVPFVDKVSPTMRGTIPSLPTRLRRKQRNILVWGLLVGLVSAVSLSLSSPAVAEFAPVELEARMQQVIAHVRPAVVALVESGRSINGAFSGVMVSAEGHILSAAHAVEPGQRYDVYLLDGRKLRGVGKGVNDEIDCALIKITDTIPADRPLPFAEMGRSRNLLANQPCLSISHPGGYNKERGAVVRFGRIVAPLTQMFGMMQSTALMEPGDSGGPLFDLDGKVIAIHSRIERSLDANYDIPIDSYRLYWDKLNLQEAFDVPRIPGVPVLGFSGRRDRELGGVVVNRIVAQGAAEIAGLQDGDVIKSVQGAQARNPQTIASVAFSLVIDGKEKMDLVLLRGEEEVKVKLPLRVVDEANDAPPPNRLLVIPELENLSRQFATLESRLDDACVSISSHRSGTAYRTLGLLLEQPGYVVTKSSMIADEPVMVLEGGRRLAVTVVSRDEANDLALLHTEESTPVGLALLETKPLSKQAAINIRPEVPTPAETPLSLDPTSLGRVLISPSPVGVGWISVISSPPFKSTREESRGYFGVVLKMDNGNVIIGELMRNGPASRAGIKELDRVLKLNNLKISTQSDVYTFLRQRAPGDRVEVQVQRGEESPTITVELGVPPEDSGHIAELFDGGKSLRRDGFTSVLCHDARLAPADCGGPLFDQQGQFVGLNIARFSRTQSYFLPRSIVAEFVKKSLPADTSTAN